jgi:uncharacterized membrane protein
MEGFIGSIMFDFIGGTIKWFIGLVINPLKGKKPKSLTGYISRRKNQSDEDFILTGISNIAIGIGTTVLFILIMIAIYD